MKKELFAFFFVATTSLILACQEKSIPNYETTLQSWIGKSEADLVETWGAPDQMQTIAPNRQIFVYIKERQVYLDDAGMPDDFLGQDSLYTQNTDGLGQVLDYYCQTIFTTQDDIIVNYSFEGDGC